MSELLRWKLDSLAEGSIAGRFGQLVSACLVYIRGGNVNKLGTRSLVSLGILACVVLGIGVKSTNKLWNKTPLLAGHSAYRRKEREQPGVHFARSQIVRGFS